MDEIEALVEPHIPALRRYAHALLRDREGADDLVQDCLERAIARWSLRRRDGDVRAWLFAILHNLFVGALRRQARRGRDLGSEAIDESASAGAGDQEARLVLRDAMAGLAALPEGQRAVLLLIGVEDFSYAQAAEVLGVPVGTVMSRLSRGRERLRLYLEGENGPLLRRIK